MPRCLHNMDLSARIRRPFSLTCSFRFVPSACAMLTAVILAGMAYAANGEGDAPQGRLITTLAVAVNPVTHKVYAVNESAGTVSVSDEKTGSNRAVKVGKGPIALAINPVTDRIYVVNTDSNSISVIDGKNDAVIATVKGGNHPYVLAVNETTNKIYVTYTYSNVVTVIDGDTGASQSLKTGSADGIAIDPRSNTLFLTTYEDPNIRIVNAATGDVTKVAVGPHLWGIAFDEALHTLYLAP